VALRDHGFTAAVDALTQSRCREHRIEVTLDVARIDALGERTQAALYQIVREALEEAIRRGPPSRFEVAATADAPGALRLVIRDDAPTERRRRAEHERLSETARVATGRDSAGVDARCPQSVGAGHARLRVHLQTPDRVRHGSRDVNGDSLVALQDGAPGGSGGFDAVVRRGDDVPRTRADELREVVLVPRDLRRRDLAPVVREHARVAT